MIFWLMSQKIYVGDVQPQPACAPVKHVNPFRNPPRVCNSVERLPKVSD